MLRVIPDIERTPAVYPMKPPPFAPLRSRLLMSWFVAGTSVLAGACVLCASQPTLESQFQEPAANQQPYVWWHWMGPNFSKAGITADLEAMQASGIGGATIFHITSAVQESHLPTANNPWPEQTYHSPAWWDAMRHAASEAERLGLEVGLHNTVGYSTTGGPWVDEARSMQQLVHSVTQVSGGSQRTVHLDQPELIADEGWGAVGRKLEFYRDLAVLAVPMGMDAVALADILDLSNSFDSGTGSLDANLPQGEWEVYRLGHASTGRPPHPVPDDLLGKVLEVDKMCPYQNAYHWDHVLHPLQEHLGQFFGTSFRHLLIDSYEAGDQSWTPRFREAFLQRKGYDPLPWLLALQKHKHRETLPGPAATIESQELTERFNWDFRDVVNQLFFENGWQVARNRLHALGLELQFEPYGGPFDTAKGSALADLPMGEFWTGGNGGISAEVVGAARAAGRRMVGAEAFTGRPEISQYTEDPAFLKRSADGSFASGVNRMILHHWVHQPFDDRYKPGMGMGWWGTHFGRNQTWFEPGKAFFQYLSRCQVLLQQGEQVADFLCVGRLLEYQDLVSVVDFLKWDIRVEDGRVVLPSGRNYPFIVFPQTPHQQPEILRKMQDLVLKGASIVANRPVASPSLQNYPQCDAEVKQLADAIWEAGASDAQGTGRLFDTVEAAKAFHAVEPGFRVVGADHPKDLRTCHRRSPQVEIFFLANLADRARHFTGSFKVAGLQPEIWNPEDGSITKAAVWKVQGNRTEVAMQLRPGQSVFFVFRKSAEATIAPSGIVCQDPDVQWATAIRADGQAVLRSLESAEFEMSYPDGKVRKLQTEAAIMQELTGPWQVLFEPATQEAPFERTFETLLDFSTHSESRFGISRVGRFLNRNSRSTHPGCRRGSGCCWTSVTFTTLQRSS
jgi:hypothetical protein